MDHRWCSFSLALKKALTTLLVKQGSTGVGLSELDVEYQYAAPPIHLQNIWGKVGLSALGRVVEKLLKWFLPELGAGYKPPYKITAVGSRLSILRGDKAETPSAINNKVLPVHPTSNSVWSHHGQKAGSTCPGSTSPWAFKPASQPPASPFLMPFPFPPAFPPFLSEWFSPSQIFPVPSVLGNSQIAWLIADTCFLTSNEWTKRLGLALFFFFLDLPPHPRNSKCSMRLSPYKPRHWGWHPCLQLTCSLVPRGDLANGHQHIFGRWVVWFKFQLYIHEHRKFSKKYSGLRGRNSYRAVCLLFYPVWVKDHVRTRLLMYEISLDESKRN